MRPSSPLTKLAAVLGILFLIACPQALAVAFTVLTWLLTTPGGAVALGVAFAASLLAAARTGHGWRASW